MSMFNDINEQSYYEHVARDIAIVINDHVDEIEDSQELLLDCTVIYTDTVNKCIIVETDYIDGDDGERYRMHGTVNAYKRTVDFLPKILYVWLKYQSDLFEHSVLIDMTLAGGY